jgi:hypothetical protein
MQRVETKSVLQQARYPGAATKNLVRAAFCTIRDAICKAWAAARHPFGRTRICNGWKFHPAPVPPFSHPRRRTIPSAPVDSAAGPALARRRIVDLPRPRLLHAVSAAPPRCTEPPPPPPSTGTMSMLPTSLHLPHASSSLPWQL